MLDWLPIRKELAICLIVSFEGVLGEFGVFEGGLVCSKENYLRGHGYGSVFEGEFGDRIW